MVDCVFGVDDGRGVCIGITIVRLILLVCSCGFVLRLGLSLLLTYLRRVIIQG